MTIQDMSTLARRLPSPRRPVLKVMVAAGLLLVTGAAIGWAVNVQLVAADGRSVATVQAQAADANSAIDALTGRLASLKKDVAALQEGNDRTTERLGRVTDSLWASLRKVRGLVSDARAGSNDALAEAGSALQRAESAARNLSVLEDRFEYHLRADHGGG